MALWGRNTSEQDPHSHALFLEGHVKTLELNLNKVEQQLTQVQQLAESYRGDARKNMGEIQRIAQTICDNEYSKQQLGGKNRILSLSSFELANFIIENWRKQRQEAIDLIVDLQKTLKRKDAELKDMEAQLERSLQERYEAAHQNQGWNPEYEQSSSPPQSSSTYDTTPCETTEAIVTMPDGRQVNTDTGEVFEHSTNDLNSGSTPDIVSVVQARDNQPAPQAATSPSTPEPLNVPKTHLVLLDELENKLSPIQREIISIIGTEGLSESKEIEQKLLEKSPDFNHTQFVNGLGGLKTNLVVGEDKVNTGWRWFMALHLTDLGLQLYHKQHGKPAVLCEKHLLRKENATWDHGYTIKDTATLMEMMGYQQINYGRKDNTIKLSNGKEWIPDITAYDTIAKKKVYIEVELGHHTQEQFNEKMDKARQVTNDLRFVTNDKSSMDTIVSQFSRWKLERTKSGAPVKNFTVWITTTKKLAEKDWGNQYPS